MLNDAIGAAALAIWIYLVFARGWFWLGRERDGAIPVGQGPRPAVAAVVPARNEAESIAAGIGSLLRQDYAGPFTVILVDDGSADGTAAAARTAAGSDDRLVVIAGAPLPAGWTGKLWAVKQGIATAEDLPMRPEYLLLTDADIVHAPDSLRWLVSQAWPADYGLVSFMAKLRCESLIERVHVPAFIFFFQMLYPFGRVNRADMATAAAAGGCMLVRADALRDAGGIESIRGALIDDCALARNLKALGPIWLGLTERVRSIRRYENWQEARAMIARSAYAQLKYSPLLLLGTTLGMALTYLAPPLLTLFGAGAARLLGVAAWGLMAVAFQPTLRFYRVSPLWGLALPGIALLYMLYTLDSAYQHARGRGGVWKGRVQANASQR